MKLIRLICALCAAVMSFISLSSHAALIGVLPATPSGTDWQAYYDDQLDITWAANANINGADTWDNQVAWVTGLTIGGVTGWRLPNADVNGDGTVVDCVPGGVAGCADNEMGFLFWEEGITAAAPGPFSNVLFDFYWSGTELVVSPSSNAWFIAFSNGTQSVGAKNFDSDFAWAVLSGGSELVSSVPTPAALWLFGSGLLGLVGMARRKKV